MITPAQLTRLHTLWNIYARATNQPADASRDTRLVWLSTLLGRAVSSMKSLSVDEARRAIDELQRHVPAESIVTRARGDRESRRQLGAAGRRGDKGKVLQAPDARTLEIISRMVGDLGWTQERFEAWMRSRSGPLGGSAAILTQAHANRVRWALKAMLKRKATQPQMSDFRTPVESIGLPKPENADEHRSEVQP